MPIDLAQVAWLYVAVLAIFVFVATGLANLLSFNHRGIAAVLAALLFAAIFIFWTYYPHGLPLPTSITTKESPITTVVPASPAVPQSPAIPQGPRNPVTDITPAPNAPR